MTVQSDPTEIRAPHVTSEESDSRETRKLAAQIAAHIEADILAAGWPVGQVLGSETELRERYGVSRAVLREAIRLVEHHEVATMRRGPSGGLVVHAPDSRPLTTAIVIYLEHMGATVEDILAARVLLEPLAARLAASRMGEERIGTLRSALDQEARLGTSGWRDLLHTTLGRLSGNPALWLFIDVLVELTSRYAQIPPPPAPAEATAINAQSDHAHHAIADAIISGDSGQAEQRTIRHLAAMRGWLLSATQQPINRGATSQWGAGQSAYGDHGAGKQKLAETVAHQMIAAITASGASVGDLVGSETELLAQFGVSRAVLREAVRLLEYHSVARMRRGPGGGLVVAAPDAAASIDAMAIYLDYERIGVDELRAVRDVIEIGCLEITTRRCDGPNVVARLRASLSPDDLSPSASIAQHAHRVHTEIAELTGNPVLALFLRILTTVWARHSESRPADAQENREIADRVDAVHQKIVDAIVAGDAPLASHRMRRHLEALTTWWQ
jgi:DNA-binding FadR family transcriptional regulator